MNQHSKNEKADHRILVTGSGGQLAYSLRKCAESTPWQWQFCDRLQLDITQKGQVSDLLSAFQPHVVINTAAYTAVEKAEEDPDTAFLVNAKAVQDLSEICAAQGIVLVHISTDYVFDGTKNSPYTPDDLTNPLNQYGKSKWAGEQAIRQHLKEHYIIRASWLYNREYGHNFYRTIVSRLRDGETLYVTNAQTGTPTDTDDLARYLIRLIADKPPFGTYHFSGERAMTWFEFATEIVSAHGMQEQVLVVPSERYSGKAVRPRYSVLAPTGFDTP